jgi:hypothetical protein
MDIQTLRVYLSEQDLQELALKLQPPDAPVKNLAVRVTPDGASVSGEAATPMLPLSFESVWLPKVVAGRVAVYMLSLKAAGVPATKILRPLVLTLLKDAIKEPFVEVLEEAIVVDVQELVRRQNLPVRLTFELQALRLVAGGVVVEAGLPTPASATPAG